MSRLVVSFVAHEEIRTYALADAPPLHGVGAMRLKVQPFKLTLSSRDSRLHSVTVTGLTVRGDGRLGAHRTATWAESEGWAGMPRWLVAIASASSVDA